MKYETYAVYDSKVQDYGIPFFTQNDGSAIRNIVAAATNGDSMLAQFPEDFILYHIGSYDSSLAEQNAAKPRQLGKVSQFLARLAAVSEANGEDKQSRVPDEFDLQTGKET